MVKKNEIMEFELSDNKIDELIKRLEELKESETHVHIEIKGCELLIHHEKDEYKC
ncbi:hypothetical protein J4438_02585 [Candidatus Woesearchaeota archaeon]|nr:hypothetical protein [Candidatus Woesearchaeota archaeon]